MTDTIDVRLTLTKDTLDSMNFLDTYEGLDDIWYEFSADADGNVRLWANADGFEHLARYFLKMARSGKEQGYHAHHKLEFCSECALTDTFCVPIRWEEEEKDEKQSKPRVEEKMAEEGLNSNPELIIGICGGAPAPHSDSVTPYGIAAAPHAHLFNSKKPWANETE
jgi:hypothetical protein